MFKGVVIVTSSSFNRASHAVMVQRFIKLGKFGEFEKKMDMGQFFCKKHFLNWEKEKEKIIRVNYT